MKPLHTNIVIKPDALAETTASGIYITSNALKELPPLGTVLSVAKGITDIQVGDRVVYAVYAGVELDDESVLVPYENVLGVLDEVH